MKAAIVEILDGPWNSAIEPEFPIDPGPSFQVQMNVREGVENVIVFLPHTFALLLLRI